MDARARLRAYAVVTAAYWAFTLTDGALRMLVLLHFHTLGYSPFQLALLFLLYEMCGVVTNLIGGWLGSRVGLKATLLGGLLLQVVALSLLSLLSTSWPAVWQVTYVVAVQGLSGIAKDLTKLSSKSAIKVVVPADASGRLLKWVALLTGSKNALKGAGFFLGGVLLSRLGFAVGLWVMAAVVAVTLGAVLIALAGDLGRAKEKVPFSGVLSKTRAINILSAARFFLFGARDVWFVVGLPVFLYGTLRWSFVQVGGYMAAWVIGYGFVQTVTPRLIRRNVTSATNDARMAQVWGFVLAAVPLVIVGALWANVRPSIAVVGGLAIFGVVFAINSAAHSYLILAYADDDKVAADVGFYYMANAGGRLVGTLLSGLVYQAAGLDGCLLTATGMVVASAVLALLLPRPPVRSTDEQ